MGEVTSLLPPCVTDPANCDFVPERSRAEWGDGHCPEIQENILDAGGAGALEQAKGCPQRATRLLMIAAVEGDPTATEIELRQGFDARPFTEAFRKRYEGGAQ